MQRRHECVEGSSNGRFFASHYCTKPGIAIARVLHEPLRNAENPRKSGGFSVRDTGIEPVTSSVSGKRATAAPIAPVRAIQLCVKCLEVATGFEPV